MKKQKDSYGGFVLAFVVIALALFAYMKHEKLTFAVNDETYIYAGMMEFKDEGKTIYLPIYRRSPK
jgi:hypothetical protein